MKAPPVNAININKVHKSDWFITESEISDLKHDYVWQNKPVDGKHLYSGMYIGIYHAHFQDFLDGSKKYHAIAVCPALMQKINAAPARKPA